jgi:hypothetical protein
MELKKGYSVKVGSNKQSCIELSRFCAEKTINIFNINEDSTNCVCSYNKKRRRLFEKVFKIK